MFELETEEEKKAYNRFQQISDLPKKSEVLEKFSSNEIRDVCKRVVAHNNLLMVFSGEERPSVNEIFRNFEKCIIKLSVKEGIDINKELTEIMGEDA